MLIKSPQKNIGMFSRHSWDNLFCYGRAGVTVPQTMAVALMRDSLSCLSSIKQSIKTTDSFYCQAHDDPGMICAVKPIMILLYHGYIIPDCLCMGLHNTNCILCDHQPSPILWGFGIFWGTPDRKMFLQPWFL